MTIPRRKIGSAQWPFFICYNEGYLSRLLHDGCHRILNSARSSMWTPFRLFWLCSILVTGRAIARSFSFLINLGKDKCLKKSKRTYSIGVMGRVSYRAIDKNRLSIVAFFCLLLSVQFSTKNTCYRLYHLKVRKCLKITDTVCIKMHA